jgi:hypothetical protein
MRGAVRDDVGAVERAGERFEKRRLADERERIRVVRLAEADGDDAANGERSARVSLTRVDSSRGDRHPE